MLSRISRLSLLLTVLPFCGISFNAAAEVPGLTAGQFRVDESGSANYNIAIAAPQGTAGVTPRVALSWSSGNQADGPLGVGWSLSGLSAITRCPQTPVDDGQITALQYNSADRFCLDGQRLLLKSGSYGAADSTYRTAVDNFATITAKQGTGSDGPQYFVISNKAGETHYYGDASAVHGDFGDLSDGFVEPGGFSSGVVAKSWALKVIKDVKDNYMLFNYAKDTAAGSFAIDNIQYTGNLTMGVTPYAEVDFIYHDHNKGFKGFQAGGYVTQNKRISRIDTSVDGDIYRAYFLTYEDSDFIEERTLLTSVQECPDNDSDLSNCRNPITLGWQRPDLATGSSSWVCETEPGMADFCHYQPGSSTYQPFPSKRTLATGTANRESTQVIDINGDGYQDLVYVSGSNWYAKMGPGHSSTINLTGVGDNKKEYALNIDYNGDGIRDLLVADSATSYWYAVSYQRDASQNCHASGPCTGDNVGSSKTVKNLGVIATGLEGEAQVMDVNGDGFEDIVFRTGNTLKAHLNDGDGTFTADQLLHTFTSSIDHSMLNEGYVNQTANMKNASGVDINGDGRSDLIIKVSTTTGGCYRNGQLLGFVASRTECVQDLLGSWIVNTVSDYQLFVGAGTTAAPSLDYLQSLGSNNDTYRIADLNGDGLSDVLYVADNQWYYRLSDGTGLLSARDTGLTTSDNNKLYSQFIDLNGDGRSDILHATSTNKWQVYFSRPTNATQWISFEYRGDRSFDNNATIRFGDTTGDGKINLLTATGSSWNEYHNRENIKEYVINQITNSNGVTTNISYKPMTDSSVYVFNSSDYDNSPDTFSPMFGMYLVSSVANGSNTNASVSVTYQYGGLLVHKQGRGSLGFQMLRTIDDQSGVVSETQYNQQHDNNHFAKARMALYTEQRINGKLLSSASNTLSTQATARGSVMAYVSQSTDAAYVYGSDGVSTLVSTTTSSSSYDSWGNLTNNTVTVTDGASADYKTAITVNDFGTSTQQQYGRLQSSQVTKNATGDSTNATRKTSYVYYSNNLLKDVIASPDVAATKVISRNFYDSFGNKKAVRVIANATDSGSEQIRESRNMYDPRGRFIDTSQNALIERTRYRYNGLTAANFTGTLQTLREISANNLNSYNDYDDFGQLISINHADSRTTNVSRSFCINCVANSYVKVLTTISGSPDKAEYFDRWGRKVADEVKTFSGGWALSTVTYDGQGRQSQNLEPGAGYPTEYSYDVLGRVVQITKANGGIVTHQVYGLEQRTTNSLGQVNKSFNNGFGQTVSTQDALGVINRFTHDAWGNVIETQTSAHNKNHIISSQYDLWGRKTRTSDPVKGIWSYSYNAFGELTRQTSARGHRFTFDYDVMGRKIRSYEPGEGTLCWHYGSRNELGDRAVGKLIVEAKYAASSVSCDTASNTTIKKTYGYDTQGRPNNTITQIGADSYSQSQTYDGYSRVKTISYPAGTSSFTVKMLYNVSGYQYSVRDNATNFEIKRINAMNDRGEVTKETYGNGVIANKDYQADTGWLNAINVSKSGVLRQYTGTSYDSVGNVTSRDSAYAGNNGADYGVGSHYSESYQYDDLNRLTGRTISITANGAALPGEFKTTHRYTLDKWGNFSFKTGAGYYKYSAGKVHKLLGVYSNADFSGTLYSFSYDANGNITGDGNRSFSYASFDKPTAISDSNSNSAMAYGVNRELYYKNDSVVENGQSVSYATTYLGGYEKVVRSGGVGSLTEHKYYVANVIYTQRSNGSNDTYYLHKDHQGSVVATTNAAGDVISQAIYDPYGKRTAVYLASQFSLFAVTEPTDRGYTGHKHMAALDVIHMGGRIYDPTLGRFLQADPNIQSPKNSQSYNRYAYVLNNPMSYTDPSGYFFKSLFKSIKKVWKQLVSVAAVFVLGPVVGGFLAGYLTTGSLKGAFIGAFAGALGAAFGGLEGVTGFLANGIVGGLANKAMGGKFSHGFVSAGLGHTAGGSLKGIQTKVGRIVAKAVVGGTLSKLTGGKFANGAMSAAFAASLAEAGSNRPMQEMTAKDREYATLADQAYAVAQGDVVGDYTVAGVHTDENGLRAALYVNGDGHSVLAFAGTTPTSWADWKANFLQGLGFTGAQYRGGIALARQYYAQTGGKLHFTGHSLGGGIASAAAIVTGGNATVFNASGIRNNTIGNVSRDNGSVTYYYSSHDVLRLGNMLTPGSVPGQHVNLGAAGFHGMIGMCKTVGC